MPNSLGYMVNKQRWAEFEASSEAMQPCQYQFISKEAPSKCHSQALGREVHNLLCADDAVHAKLNYELAYSCGSVWCGSLRSDSL